MRITKKMLNMATAGIPMVLADELASRRWHGESVPFTNGLKNAVKSGEMFTETQLKAYARREQGDPVNLSLYIWLVRAVQKICPERVDSKCLDALEKETADRGWLLG